MRAAHPTRSAVLVHCRKRERETNLEKKIFLLSNRKVSIFHCLDFFSFSISFGECIRVCVSVAVAYVAAIKLSPKKNDIKQRKKIQQQARALDVLRMAGILVV